MAVANLMANITSQPYVAIFQSAVDNPNKIEPFKTIRAFIRRHLTGPTKPPKYVKLGILGSTGPVYGFSYQLIIIISILMKSLPQFCVHKY